MFFIIHLLTFITKYKKIYRVHHENVHVLQTFLTRKPFHTWNALYVTDILRGFCVCYLQLQLVNHFIYYFIYKQPAIQKLMLKPDNEYTIFPTSIFGWCIISTFIQESITCIFLVITRLVIDPGRFEGNSNSMT